MKINGLIKKARWESIPCNCGKEVMDSFPIKECLHCKFDQCWKSVPKKDFTVNEYEMKNEKPTGKIIKREVKIINLVRGSKYQDVVGWTW
jgi:hypothetical protein